jgi:hypothetical protein
MRSSFKDRCIESEPFVVRRKCRWKEKRDEEAQKKEKKGLSGKVSLCS